MEPIPHDKLEVGRKYRIEKGPELVQGFGSEEVERAKDGKR